MKRNGFLKRAAIAAAIGVIMCTAASGCSKSQVENTVEAILSDPETVAFVKNGTLNAYPDQKIGDAFKNFFGSPLWSEFTSTDGEQVVEFNGTCYYMDTEVNATIQFLVDLDAGTFSVHTVLFNDIPQNLIVQNGLLTKVFEG